MKQPTVALLLLTLGAAPAFAWTSFEPTYRGTDVPENSAEGYITQPGGGDYTLLTPVSGPGQIPDPSRRSYLIHNSSDDSVDRLRSRLHEDDALIEMRDMERRRRLENDD